MNKKKYLIMFFILTLICLFLYYPYMQNYVNIIDDMSFHMNRIKCLADNLRAGEILPSIYGSAMNGYGYANGLFYPDLFLYIPATLVALNMNLVLSYRIFICLINIVTGITAFLSIKNILKIKKIKNIKKENDKGLFSYCEKVALLSSIIYLTFPYRLVDIYVRGAIGEILSFIFIPIVIWGVYEIFEKEDGNYKILVIGMVGLLNSHVITLFLMSIFIFIFAIFNIKKIKKASLKLLKATVFTTLIGAIFLLPMIEQMISDDFYYQKLKPLGEIYEHTYNLFGIENQYLLLVLNLVIIITIFISDKYLKNFVDNISVSYLMIGIYIVLLITDFFPWHLISEKLPIINLIQFPWRLLIFFSWFISIAISLKVLDIWGKKSFSIILLMAITICMFLGNIFIDPFIKVDKYYTKPLNYVPNSIDLGFVEYAPIDFNYKEYSSRDVVVKEINNKEMSYSYSKKGNKLTIKFKSNEKDLNLEIPLIYYKGYKAYLNDNEINIYKKNGLVHVNTDNYSTGAITIQYEHTLVQIISYLISIISVIALIRPFKIKKNKEFK